MTTNPPPEWAMNAAKEIDGESYYDYRPDVTDIARIIAAHAPNAEALAEALEKYILVFDDPRHSDREVKHWLDTEWIPEIRRITASYRATHPKPQA